MTKARQAGVWFGGEREGIVWLIEIGLALDLLAALPPHLDHADFRKQRVLDEGVEHQKARIFAA